MAKTNKIIKKLGFFLKLFNIKMDILYKKIYLKSMEFKKSFSHINKNN